MSNKNNIGTQVKTGDKFNLKGWWVCKNLKDKNNPLFIDDPDDKVPGGSHRLLYIYFGNTQPNKDEMKRLIENTQFEHPEAKY